MFNLNSSDSYVNLLKRITQRVQQAKVEDQILEIMQQAVEKELGQQNIVLSKPERIRLSHQVTKAIFANILTNIDDESKK